MRQTQRVNWSERHMYVAVTNTTSRDWDDLYSAATYPFLNFLTDFEFTFVSSFAYDDLVFWGLFFFLFLLGPKRRITHMHKRTSGFFTRYISLSSNAISPCLQAKQNASKRKSSLDLEACRRHRPWCAVASRAGRACWSAPRTRPPCAARTRRDHRPEAYEYTNVSVRVHKRQRTNTQTSAYEYIHTSNRVQIWDIGSNM